MRIVSVSVTEAGRGLACRLPFEHVHGGLGETVRARWGEVDGFVLFAAVGIAVRVTGPLLDDKRTDPAVVCVDEAGRFAVAVAGGHAGGANRLAEEVAARLGATAVITTATDAAGVVALDALPGVRASGSGRAAAAGPDRRRWDRIARPSAGPRPSGARRGEGWPR